MIPIVDDRPPRANMRKTIAAAATPTPTPTPAPQADLTWPPLDGAEDDQYDIDDRMDSVGWRKHTDASGKCPGWLGRDEPVEVILRQDVQDLTVTEAQKALSWDWAIHGPDSYLGNGDIIYYRIARLRSRL